MTKDQFEKYTSWQKEKFPVATALSKVFHLEKEVHELKKDLIDKKSGRVLEFADCFLLLFGAAASDGMSYRDIVRCIDEKMLINYKRKWSQPDQNGDQRHVSDEPELRKTLYPDNQFRCETIVNPTPLEILQEINESMPAITAPKFPEELNNRIAKRKRYLKD